MFIGSSGDAFLSSDFRDVLTTGDFSGSVCPHKVNAQTRLTRTSGVDLNTEQETLTAAVVQCRRSGRASGCKEPSSIRDYAVPSRSRGFLNLVIDIFSEILLKQGLMKTSAPVRTRNQSVSINLEKSLSRYALATAGLAAVAAIPTTAKADFSGYYAPPNWTLQNTGDSNGFVDTSGAPASITLHGGSSGSGNAGDTDFTIAAAASGLLSFNWSYFSTDTGTYDSAYFLLNGVPTFLADNGSQGSGTFSIAVSAGNIFGFRVHTEDNLFGDGELTVSNFSAPVPEGSTLSLFALGAAGVMVLMRRRAQAAV